MKNLIILFLSICFWSISFSQLTEKHNIYYFKDSIWPIQINEYSIRYDKDETPKDTSLSSQILFSQNGQLYKVKYNFREGYYITDYYDTLYPFKKLKTENPFSSLIPKAGVSFGIKETEIIEYNIEGQIISHVYKYRDLSHLRIFNFYNENYKIIEQKRYWDFKLTRSTYIEYIF